MLLLGTPSPLPSLDPGGPPKPSMPFPETLGSICANGRTSCREQPPGSWAGGTQELRLPILPPTPSLGKCSLDRIQR